MRAKGGRPPWCGFTLIEIIVGLTIVAVIVAVAVPTVSGLQDERRARVPLDELATMVAEVREQATRDRRAYQIVFGPDGFRAAPFLHAYASHDEFARWFERIQEPPGRNRIQRQEVQKTEIRREGRFDGLFEEAAPARAAGSGTDVWQPPFVGSYRYPEGVRCELRFWGEHGWAEVGPGQLRRWVFQPTGLVSPLGIRFTSREAFFETGFDPLTGETSGERSSVVPPQQRRAARPPAA